MREDIQSFLATSPIFKGVPTERLAEIAQLFRTESHQAGAVILRQGGYSPALYFLRSGRLVVCTRRGECRETLAYLQPPAIVGELSVLTGACCVADVEVEVDAELVLLPKEDLPKLAAHGEMVFWGLLHEIAQRMRERVTLGQKIPELPTVLLHNHANWEAPVCFGLELSRSLARQTERPTLLVYMGAFAAHDVRQLDSGGDAFSVALAGHDEGLRVELAEKLTLWQKRFENVVLNPVGPQAATIAEATKGFANIRGDLLGPGDPIPVEAGGAQFVVQSAAIPTLPFLDGGHQLAFDVAASESAHLAGQAVAPRFQRTVDSMARRIAGIQVGLALGGGVAWGMTHVGVVSVLENAGVPIDCISGSSAGSLAGGLRSIGLSADELHEVAGYFAKHSKRLFEWRFWHMCLLNERFIMRILRRHFGDRLVNQTEIPYWANAVDIQTGREHIIKTGSLVECIRASIALPGGLSPRQRDGHLLVDAIVANPVPVSLVREMGCHFSIAVNAMPKTESETGKIRVAGPLSFQQIKRRWPLSAPQILIRCILVGGHEIGQSGAERQADIVLRPALSQFGVVEFSRSLEIAESGRRVAEEQLPAILAGYRDMKARALGKQPRAV